MKKTTSLFVVAAIFLAVGIAGAKDRRSVVPSKILSARTIFVDNETPDAELQLVAVMGLSKWGRYDIVDSPQKADIILRLVGSGTVRYVPASDVPRTYEPKPATAIAGDGEELAPAGCTRLDVVEPKSGSTLWSEIRKTGNVQEKSRLVEGLHEAVDQQEKSRR